MYQDESQPLIDINTVFEIEHIYAKMPLPAIIIAGADSARGASPLQPQSPYVPSKKQDGQKYKIRASPFFRTWGSAGRLPAVLGSRLKKGMTGFWNSGTPLF